MAGVKLRWTKKALFDFANAYDYIAGENHYAARDCIERIEQAVSMLALHPDMGRPGRLKATRELVITDTPFIFAYRIDKNVVEILALFHHARAWPKML